MVYLEEKEIVLRDLSTRNCLVGSDLSIRLGDVLPPRTSFPSDYEFLKGASTAKRYPVRWMAPEILESPENYTFATDVWAYGVTLWEIGTLGLLPYTAMSNNEVVNYINDGGRLTATVCDEMALAAEIRNECFTSIPRPTFVCLSAKLRAFFDNESVGQEQDYEFPDSVGIETQDAPKNVKTNPIAYYSVAHPISCCFFVSV